MQKVAIISLCFLLAACMTPEQRAARQQQIKQADHNQCVELGFKPKTDAYGNCRLRLMEMRAKRQQVIYPYVGVGYNHHFHRRHW